MAENVFAVTQSTPGQELSTARVDDSTYAGIDFLSCGKVIEGTRIEIRDARDQVVAEGCPGEVCIQGNSLFEGYFKQPELTKAKYYNGWYHSRDMGFVRNGELFICGRMEDLIIVAGRNIYAHDAENCLSEIEGLKPGRSVVFGVDNVQTGTSDIVVLAEAANSGYNDSLLKQRIREKISSTLLVMPSTVKIIPLDTLVKTTSGKINREANRNRYLSDNLSSWNPSQQK